jgi:DNA-binding MarR family transcriptional regulator
LDADETRAWVGLAGLMVWLPHALDAQLQRDAGITHVEYQVLSWLSMSTDRRARMSQIAEMANVNLSHLSRIAGRFEKRGWIQRVPDPEDGRATLAVLTEAGWAKVVATAPGHAAEVQRLVFDSLTVAQVSQVQEISERVLEAIRPGFRLPLPPQPGTSL